MNSSMPIEMRKVTLDYGKGRGIFNVSFQVSAGEIVGIAGRNGTGKTTILRIASGLERPDSGLVTVCGVDAIGHPLRARHSVGCCFTQPAFYNDLTVDANLRLFARLQGIYDNSAREAALLLTGLDRLRHVSVGRISCGIKQRLGLSRALLGSPRVLLLDEPTANLDREASNDLWSALQVYAKSGGAVLVSSHSLDDLQQYASKTLTLTDGECVSWDVPKPRGVAQCEFVVTFKRNGSWRSSQAPSPTWSHEWRSNHTLVGRTALQQLPSVIVALPFGAVHKLSIKPLLSGKEPISLAPVTSNVSYGPHGNLPNQVGNTKLRNSGSARAGSSTANRTLRLLWAEVWRMRPAGPSILTSVVLLAMIALVARNLGYFPGMAPSASLPRLLSAVAQFAMLTVGGSLVAGLSSAALSSEIANGTLREVLVLPYRLGEIVFAKIMVGILRSLCILGLGSAATVCLIATVRPNGVFTAIGGNETVSAINCGFIGALCLTLSTYIVAVLIGTSVSLLFNRAGTTAPVLSATLYLFLDIGKEFSSDSSWAFTCAPETAWRMLSDRADGIIGAESLGWHDYSPMAIWTVTLACVIAILVRMRRFSLR